MTRGDGGALGPHDHKLRVQETRFRQAERATLGGEAAWSTSAPNPGMVLQRHQPGDNWGLPGALELGGAGISDSGEVSSGRGREEGVRTFMQTQCLGRGRSGGDPTDHHGREPDANNFLKVAVVMTFSGD